MAMTTDEKAKYIAAVRDSVQEIISGLQSLDGLKKQWDALDMGGLSSADKLQDSDFTGVHAGLTTADITAVVGTSLSAFNVLLAQGHATNFYRVRR